MSVLDDRWAAGDAYEAYMGRWSRPLADRFVRWLGAGTGLTWLDVGCGTGALTKAICELADPAAVVACDPSKPFVDHFASRFSDPRVSVVVGGTGSLPDAPTGFDRIVSALVLNFVPDAREAVADMRARLRPGGVVAAVVWDYAGGMEFLRIFWDEAVAMDPAARTLDEGTRFPICRSDRLEDIFRDAGLREVTTRAIEVPTRFDTFADYWQPFLGGSGPAPAYVASLTQDQRDALRSRLEQRLTPGGSGPVDLVARAWAVRGGLQL
jgi:SAM-dependent methyltransferase